MHQVQVVVEHRSDIPGGLPAVWFTTRNPTGCGKRLTLYLDNDLPVSIADHFRSMAVRCAMPESDFDSFTVASRAVSVVAVSA